MEEQNVKRGKPRKEEMLALMHKKNQSLANPSNSFKKAALASSLASKACNCLKSMELSVSI